MPRRLSHIAAAAFGGTALLLGIAQQAGASDTSNLNNVTLSPLAATYPAGTGVTVTASGLTPSTSYTVGQCEYTTYQASVGKVPACTNQTAVTSSATGTLSVSSYALVKTGTNVHKILGGAEPLNVDCGANKCEVVVSPAHGGGSGGSYKGDSKEFKVT